MYTCRSKYPLALINKLNEVHPHAKMIGYDIGCSFRSTATKAIPGLNARFIVPSMHSYAHNRGCQLSHHPLYSEGCGIEDFEMCERFFSVSNNCAGITRYTTPFHRHQLLDTHFSDHDQSRRNQLGRFIYQKYKEVGDRIETLTDSFRTMGLEDSVRNKVYETYLEEERSHLNALKTEPPADSATFNYVAAMDSYTLALGVWEDVATKAALNPSANFDPNKPLPKVVRDAFKTKNEKAAELMHFQALAKVLEPWTETSEEYIEAKKGYLERKYRNALDRVERLVIQRLFELQKANLVSTGKCF